MHELFLVIIIIIPFFLHIFCIGLNMNQNELINVYRGSEIKDISGYVGNFETTIEKVNRDE